jgi:hypothetical protein
MLAETFAAEMRAFDKESENQTKSGQRTAHDQRPRAYHASFAVSAIGQQSLP